MERSRSPSPQLRAALGVKDASQRSSCRYCDPSVATTVRQLYIFPALGLFLSPRHPTVSSTCLFSYYYYYIDSHHAHEKNRVPTKELLGYCKGSRGSSGSQTERKREDFTNKCIAGHRKGNSFVFLGGYCLFVSETWRTHNF